jgi:hypothetical protein
MALSDWKPDTSWIALYAAIVATSAFFLNLKSWFESGVRLRLSVISDGMIIGGDPAHDERDLVILTVVNRGDAPTMITTMVVLEINSWYQLWRVRPAAAYMIPNPQPRGHPCNVPADLDPGKKWTGFVRNRQDEPKRVDFRDGWHYVGVYTTARNRPYLKRIRRVMKKAA